MRRAQRGFTMIELLVAMALSVVGFMAILGLDISANRGLRTTGQSQEAIMAGEQTLESLRGMRFAELTKALTGSPTTLPPFAKLGYATITGRNGLAFQVDVAVTSVPASSGLVRLRVDVTWSDDGEAPRRLPLEVLRTVQEAM